MKVNFNKIKAQAEVYSQEATIARHAFFTALACDVTNYELEDWPVGWIEDEDDLEIIQIEYEVAAGNAAAELKRRGLELNDVFNCFFVKYYNCELYFYGEFNAYATSNTLFADPAEDLGLTNSQVKEIRSIINKGVKTAFKNLDYCKMSYKACLAHFKMQDESIKNLINK
jgi:hypothetical protein